MKIAIICNYILLPDRIGGMDHFYQSYNQKLMEKEVEVDWYFTNYTPFEFYKELNIYSANGASVEQLFLTKSVSQKKEYTTIITHFTELCTSFYKECHQLYPKANIVAVDHNPRPLEGFSFKKRIKKRVKSFLYEKYINEFIAVSEYSKKHLINDFGTGIKNKIKIVYNGIDSKNYILKKEYNFKGKFIVACHLREEKGIQYLLRSLSIINKKLLKNITIDIYGEGPYEKDLMKITKDYSLNKVICFNGSVDNLSEIYYRYDYLIHPSLGETFCYSVVEALLCKLPLITTQNSGNVLELIKEAKNGFLFKEKDENKLGEILIEIINKNKGIDFSDFESVTLPDFSLNKMVSEHIKLLPCT